MSTDMDLKLPDGYELRVLPGEQDGSGGAMLALIGPLGDELKRGSSEYGRNLLRWYAEGHAAGVVAAIDPDIAKAQENVERAARELDHLFEMDGGGYSIAGEQVDVEAGAALLSLHDYLNDLGNARLQRYADELAEKVRTVHLRQACPAVPGAGRRALLSDAARLARGAVAARGGRRQP